MTFKSITLTAVLLSFAVSSYAACKNIECLLPEIQNPSKSAEVKAAVSTDTEAAQTLLVEAFRTDKDAAYRCAAIEALTASKDAAVSQALAQAVKDPNPGVRACAARAAGESGNDLAVDNLLADIEKYQLSAGKGPYENDLQARLGAINSIWSLGEIGNPKVMNKLAKFYGGSDDVIKINLIVSMGKLKDSAKAAPYLKNIAASARETEVVRAAAFEMLEETGQSAVMSVMAPSKSTGIEQGDIIYTGGILGTMNGWISPDLPIGHAGIFAGTEVKNGRIYVLISDCVPNQEQPGGVRNIKSWKKFTHEFKFPYYGNRTTKPKPTAAQRGRIVRMALQLGTKGLLYDSTHISQKGPLEFDCVGYTEYLYEQAGLNPTDDSYETGWGWPLTPFEQFNATYPNTPAAHAFGPAAQPPSIIQAPQPAVYKNFSGLMGAFGVEGMAPVSAVNTDIRPARAD